MATHRSGSDAWLRDAALSFRARGILAWVLGQADDYQVDAHLLAAEGDEGRSAVLTALGELEDAGYLVRERVQGEKGRWVSTSEVYDSPRAVAPREVPGPPQTFTPDELPKAKIKGFVTYKIFDAAGRLLYVGVSRRPKARFRTHSGAHGSRWWPEVATVEVTWWPTMRRAEQAEAELIRGRPSPVHNIAGR